MKLEFKLSTLRRREFREVTGNLIMAAFCLILAGVVGMAWLGTGMAGIIAIIVGVFLLGVTVGSKMKAAKIERATRDRVE